MKQLNKHTLLVFLIGVFVLIQATYAQKEVDSTLAIANRQIYENPDEAIRLATQAYNSTNISINNKINALLSISTAYSSKRDYEMASVYVEKIKALLPNIQNTRQRMNILNRIAAHYQELQIYDKAIEYLDEALLLLENQRNQDSIQPLLGYNATMRGFIYRKQMNCDIALNYFNEAIEYYKKTLEAHVRNANLSICYYNKGNCLLSLGKNISAKASFLSSIEYAKNAQAKSLVAFGQKGLAEAKTLEGNYEEAIELLNNATNNAESVGDLVLNKGLYDGLSNNYLAIKDWENYTLFHNKYLNLQNETKTAERKSINQSLLKLTETKTKEINELSKYYKPILILIIIFIVLALFILIRFVLFEEKKLKNLQRKLTE
ncbi:tetratricopeptide repeat protein [Aequorivita sp. F47161]|uniref:Tetratricopeptide repeat protein n=1 Tax=Aequorivita vitellina TaxID=2874475 RepID=A0A9X1R110_9FLAO|nr:tetratricopeptide repeat protein [Aequorivita vitellina]MCG2420224.1 tetratricopeptide repeat protein [Aequorivita vitellina]